MEGEDIDEKVLGEGRRKVEDFAEGKRGGTIVDVAESALIAVVVVVKGKSEHIEAGAVGDMGKNPMVLELQSLAACRKCIFKSTAKLYILTNCRMSMRPLELFLPLF